MAGHTLRMVACAPVLHPSPVNNGITIVALRTAAFTRPNMKDGKREKWILSLFTTSGSLDLLFPTSLPLMLYGVIVQKNEHPANSFPSMIYF